MNEVAEEGEEDNIRDEQSDNQESLYQRIVEVDDSLKGWNCKVLIVIGL